MKNLIFKGDLITADFEEKPMTFEIENDMVVQAGNYTIVKTDDYEKLVNDDNWERKALHIDGVSVSVCPKCKSKYVYYWLNDKTFECDDCNEQWQTER